ncbi:MAG: hypothetical protein JO179_00010 [Solirubrobacterales bacterium]|nr:hypothetical protein [Solirubrobacterales bacterium]
MSASVVFGLIGSRASALLTRLTIVVVTLCLAWPTLAVAAAPAPHIYWANTFASSIGRANIDGTGANPSFAITGALPFEVAVDGQHMYWATPGAIGSAKLDGTGVNNNFVTGLGNNLNGVAVDAQHVYWADGFGSAGGPGIVGRANLNGMSVNQNFITGHDEVTGVAVEGQHIYWSDYDSGQIGTANLDGSDASNYFVNASNPTAIAVNSQYIYWANDVSATIGRASLDGSSVNPSLVTGLNEPKAVAVDGQHVYWANGGSHSIGRANLDGTGVNQNFITGAGDLSGVAVSPPIGLTAPAVLFKLRLAAAGPRSVAAGKFAIYRVTVSDVPLRHARAQAAKNVEIVITSAGRLVRRVLVPTLQSGRTHTVHVRLRVPSRVHGPFCVTAAAIDKNAQDVIAHDCAPVAR